jgi:hypothetical protein
MIFYIVLQIKNIVNVNVGPILVSLFVLTKFCRYNFFLCITLKALEVVLVDCYVLSLWTDFVFQHDCSHLSDFGLVHRSSLIKRETLKMTFE